MDLAKIEELIEVLQSSRTEELSVRKGECTVHLRKGRKVKSAPAETAPLPREPEAPALEESSGEHAVFAPMVGVFHTVDGIAQVGARISAGQVVGTIESMKLLNDIVSDTSGTVSQVLVEDGMPVEYGQPLCKIKPTS